MNIAKPRSFPGADIGSDHELVTMAFRRCFQRVKNQGSIRIRSCSCQTSVKKTSLDPSSLKQYQPVSNLPFLSKALERIVLKQFLQHLQSHSLLEPFQSAYRKCHSTETALLRVVNDVFRLQTVVVCLFYHFLTCRQPLTQLIITS